MCVHVHVVVGVIKMGNIIPRAGLEPTSLAFQASVLPYSPCRLPDVNTMPIPTCLCSSFPQRSVQTTALTPPPGIVSLLMLTYIICKQWAYIYIHMVGSTTILACIGS